MSFPGSFGSQLSSIMEALLKAVVAEVTALVEDGAMELRLELRDRHRQILEKEQELEERDRVIEELRVAVEELTALEEEEAASPVEDREEQTESREWTKEEEEEPIVKCELTEELPTASEDLHPESLWTQPRVSPTLPPTPTTTTSTTHFYFRHSPKTEDVSYFQNTLPLDSLLNMNLEPFDSTQPGFPLSPHPAHALNRVSDKGWKKSRSNVMKQLTCGGFRCNQCDKTFTVKWRLTTHQSVHTGAKPHTCRRCGKRFSRRDNCTRHEKSGCLKSPGKSLLQTAAMV